MNQHMKNTLPAHLQRQMNSGAYMSTQTQRAISDHMQKTMPAHLKQYAGAYMEQQVANPHPAGGSGFTPGSTVRPHAPVPDRLRLDHSNVSAGQYDAQFHTNLFAPDQPAPAAQVEEYAAPPGGPPPAPQPQTPQPGQPGAGQGGPYGSEFGFIMEPPPPPRRSLLPTNASLPLRIGVVAGGFIVLLILFSVVKGLLSGSGNTPALISVAQDQQKIIHVTTSVITPQNDQAVLSDNNKNFAATAQLSMLSAQQQMLLYLKSNGKKVNAKTLNLKINAMTDQQLAASATNSTYDSTFKQIMQDQLSEYQASLKQAYQQTGSAAGRKLINDDYKASQLLLTDLNTPAD